MATSLFLARRLGNPQGWIGGDYAQYVMHASNLVEGRPFEVTGYIYNPEYASLAPRAYPPGYPVLLAPVYALFGTDLLPMRVLSVVFFAGSLFLLGLVYRSLLPPEYALAGVALVGLNPLVQRVAIDVGSDIPFLFFLLSSLIMLDRWEREESLTKALLIGVVIFLAFSIRTVGGLLAPALLLVELGRTRRVGRGSLVSLGAFAVLVAAQSLWSSGSASYLDQFRPTLEVLIDNVTKYGWTFSALWDTGLDDRAFFELWRKVFTLFAGGAIAVGFYSKIREEPSAMDLFFVFYLAVIISWPAYQGFRFLLPIFPMAVLYLLMGTRTLSERARPAVLRTALVVAVTALPLVFYASFQAFYVPPQRPTVTDAPSRALFSFLQQTPETSVFVNVKPRILSLMTGRRAWANHEPENDRELFERFAEVGVTHVVLGPTAAGRREYLDAFVRRYPEAFRSVFHNEAFEVFQALD